ncbi:MAG: serine/threonine-protein kinase [Thermoanaerobaculia bacterium]
MAKGTPPNEHDDAFAEATLRRSSEDTPTIAGEQPVQAAFEFVPGTILLGRYRIVSKLGKGGMGEVYRADDLKLGQAVALKFLTPGKALSERQQQLIDEVRIGRDVSHPNVCRLYDIGEVGGNLFISMEYIDGEDLASLLRRIGRLPGDKALALAREICAGLGAAHDRGVVHRDLKPANIMIDGRGRARITDFGLARVEGQRDEQGLVSGTPVYMAPEQFEGKPATIASDLYAVGLILFEIWSGRRFISGKSLTEISAQHRSDVSRQSLKSTLEIDGPVAAVIEMCLARDPAARPASARAVLDALPGGDALEAAVAAGETPSPAMVAAASEKGELSRLAAWSCLVFVLLGAVALAALTQRTTVRGRVSLPYPPSRLEVRAQEVISSIGWSERDAPRVDQASSFQYDNDFLRWRERQQGSTSTSIDHAMQFEYRQSPRPMVSHLETLYRIWSFDPPFDEPGMVRLALTTDGHLRAFAIVPPPAIDPVKGAPAVQWSRLLDLAGLEPGSLARSVPESIAPVDNDQKAAWTGRDPVDGTPIRIEAASFRGRPVWFRVIQPWKDARRKSAPVLADAIRSAIEMAGFMALPIAALLLARRNLRRGQGDRRGATRLALFILAVWMADTLLSAHHVPDVQEELAMTGYLFGNALFVAVALWFGYVALEPFARRRWPRTLISWSRLLEGRVLDPMIGRDILIGLAGGIVITSATHLTAVVPAWLGLDTPIPLLTSAAPLSSLWDVASSLFAVLTEAVFRVAAFMAFLVFLRGLLRNETATILVASALVCAGALNLATGPLGVRVAAGLVMTSIALLLLFRLGLLAFCAQAWVLFVANRFPLTLDPSSWYFGRSLFVLMLIAGVALFAFWRSLGGKPILPGPVFED